MIIHQPEITIKDGYAILWSKLETRQPRENFPEYLWYRVPEKYAPILNTQSDPFLVASLLAGMNYGEEIHIRGTVSPKLAYHLNEYQFLLNLRMPEILQPIKIHYNHLERIKENPTGIGTTFSGGVDSLHTIWEHLPQNQPIAEFQVTHGIFIRGFDILHNENEYYQKILKKFKNQASTINIEVIELHTNMVMTANKNPDIDDLNGPLLNSTALALSGLFQRFFLPSSSSYYSFNDFVIESDPLTDRLLSTDTLEVIHHGSTNRRIEKLNQIADWEISFDLLRVCQEINGEEKWNCSRCEKCLRTAIPLYSAGTLDKYKTFEKPLQNNLEVLWYARKFNLWSNFYLKNEIIPFALKNKPELVPFLYLARFFGHIRFWIVKYLPKFIKNWLRVFGYYVTKDEAPNSYEVNEMIDKLEN